MKLKKLQGDYDEFSGSYFERKITKEHNLIPLLCHGK